MNQEINRFKNPGLWTSTIANVAAIIGLFSTVDTSPYVKAGIIIVGMLTQYGILQNPKTKTEVANIKDTL